MLRTIGLAVAGASISAPDLGAQDVEMVAEITGVRLPQGYYERVRQDPSFFEFSRGWIAKAETARRSGDPLGGVLSVPIVHGLFADSPPPVVSAAEVQRAFFDGPFADGTVSDFYLEASRGLLTVVGLALPWVRTSVSRDSAVGGSNGLGPDAATAVYLVDALMLSDLETDFGAFDNDGPDGEANSGDDDGFVDAVAMHFTEIAASCGGPGFWPHRSSIENWVGTPFETNDSTPAGQPILVNDYIMQSAVTCDGQEVARTNVIAHELGHILGLPDYYDPTEGSQPDRRRWVLGCWGLMAAGGWGCGNLDPNLVRSPTGFSAWAKLQLGWLANVEMVPEVMNREFTLAPVQTSGHVLQIPLSSDGSSEFLIAEYRDTVGFDAGLPAAGVLLYHVEPERPLRPCFTCAKIYQVALVEADANGRLTKKPVDGGNRGEATDAFARVSTDRFTNGTRPSARLNSGPNSRVMIHAISIDDRIATLKVTTREFVSDRLVGAFLSTLADPLTAEETIFLDTIGNQNGRYDVGDLRAFLGDNPTN